MRRWAFRRRVGWAPGPWLLYASGGLAYGTVDVNSSVTGQGFSPLPAAQFPLAPGFLTHPDNDHAHFQVATIGISWPFSPSGKGPHAVYVGVMAQEVALVMPSAVVKGDDGYLRVDYGKLGLPMRTVEEWQALTYGIQL